MLSVLVILLSSQFVVSCDFQGFSFQLIISCGALMCFLPSVLVFIFSVSLCFLFFPLYRLPCSDSLCKSVSSMRRFWCSSTLDFDLEFGLALSLPVKVRRASTACFLVSPASAPVETVKALINVSMTYERRRSDDDAEERLGLKKIVPTFASRLCQK